MGCQLLEENEFARRRWRDVVADSPRLLQLASSFPGSKGVKKAACGSMSLKTWPSCRNTRLVVDELERADLGKMNI
jgi:hypothetical protein